MTSAESIPEFTHEHVTTIAGRRSGLVMAVAIHSSALGPAIGGCRIWNYPHWVDAVGDAMRLSAAMTLKNAAAGLDNGGGKCVICVPEGEILTGDRRRSALLDLGDLIESLEGRYRTGQDVGTTEDDMRVLHERTGNIIGLPADLGGPGSTTEPTALGVFACIETTMKEITGSSDLGGRRVVVSGLGQIGGRVAELVSNAGGRVFAGDIDLEKKAVAAHLGATWVEPGSAHTIDADVYVPAGVGGVITSRFVDELNARAVVGPANNQLAERADALRLAARGIVYAPDFIVNSGGAIFLALSAAGLPASEVEARVRGIGETLAAVLAAAKQQGTDPLTAAESLAGARLRAAPRR